MICGKLFGIPSEEGVYEKAIEILIKEFGLVDGHNEAKNGDYRVLVWEDERGIGRFRVHCCGNYLWPAEEGKTRDVFNFHYWMNRDRMDIEIFKRDPMKTPLDRIQNLSQNVFHTDHLFCELSLEELDTYIKKNKQ